MYKYGIVCFTGIMISSLVGRSVCSIHIFYLQDIILIHVQYNTLYHACIYNCLPEDEPSGSKHIEDQISNRKVACWFILYNYGSYFYFNCNGLPFLSVSNSNAI